MKPHMNHKISNAKQVLNRIWNQIIKRKEIPLDKKASIFNAAISSIVSYIAQVWDFAYVGRGR